MKDFSVAKGDLGESGGAPLQGKRGRGRFRKKKTTSYDFLKKNFLVQWTGHCTAGISKSIISNDYKNEEAGHGPVPKDIQTRSLFLQQCNSFVKIIQDSIESRI